MIAVSQLTFRYPNALGSILCALSFEVKRGEMLAVVGEPGVGKTTLLRILAGLESSWSGSIEVMRRPLQAWGKYYYERIGLSLDAQRHDLELSARENLDFFGALYDVRTLPSGQLLAELGLAEVAGRKVRDLSHDQRKRLALARSLIHDPELWLVDAPFAGLDTSSVQIVQGFLLKQRALGKSIVIAARSESPAAGLCDRQLHLRRETLAAGGLGAIERGRKSA